VWMAKRCWTAMLDSHCTAALAHCRSQTCLYCSLRMLDHLLDHYAHGHMAIGQANTANTAKPALSAGPALLAGRLVAAGRDRALS
jgi:hypothetical protein